jgi:dienelactone hydrolase
VKSFQGVLPRTLEETVSPASLRRTLGPALVLAALCATSARAAENSAGCEFKKGISATVSEYFSADKPPPDEELRCTKKGSGWACHMSGWLVRPEDDHDGHLPVIVFIHGSAGLHPEAPATSRGYVCEIANYFVPRGYAIWMPFLRGYSDSSPKSAAGSGFHNTGTSYADWSTAEAGKQGHDQTWWTLYYMKNGEMHDIQQAITHLTRMKTKSGKPFADESRIALMGHSFGGARVVLATSAGLKPKPRAVIDLSGAAMSWDTAEGEPWSTFMKEAAEKREMPLYIHMNTLENPKGLMSAALETFMAANKSHVAGAEVSLYSKFDIPRDARERCKKNGIPDYWCAHSWFVLSAEQTARWLPNVHAFLDRYGFKK